MEDSGLQQSKWAPSSQKITGSNGRNPAIRKTSIERRRHIQLEAYQRFLKSFRRLKWKSTALLFSHHRALSQQTDNVILDANFPIASDTGKANPAVIMFKADFFEYYSLLERVLVHLLESFGMVISADHTTNFVPLPLAEKDLNRGGTSSRVSTEDSIIGNSRAFNGYAHRYHANVLAALGLSTNPLHSTLGTGKAFQYLAVAKAFRNGWKDVEQETEVQDPLTGLHKSYHQILTELNLDKMLVSILSAIEASGNIASQELTHVFGSVEVDMLGVDEADATTDLTMGDDAMDCD